MLFGTCPFIADDKNSLLNKITLKKYNYKNKGVKISKPIRELLEKILEPNPEKRLNFQELLI